MSANNNQRKKPNNTNKQTDKTTDSSAETAKKEAQLVAENSQTSTAKDSKTAGEKIAETASETSKKVEGSTPPNPQAAEASFKQAASQENQGKTTQQSAPKNATPPKPAEVKHDNKAPSEKKTGLLAPLALIAGIAGTGIGVFNYDQVRKLKAETQTAPLLEQLKGLESQVAELSTKNADDAVAQLKEQLDTLNASIKASEDKVNQRLSAVEQTQNGLTKTLQGDMKETLDKRLQEVNALLSKVDQIELTQESISQNLNQAVAAGEAVTAEGMAKQEVGYLLRMADYKIQSEGDAVGAAGLLEIAEKKLLLLNQGQSDSMVDHIRQKYIQLQGVKTVDSNALISNLKEISGIVPGLMPKPSESKPVQAEQGTTEESSSLLGQVGDILASGIKYTPNDPSKIDISAETILIEKRLMQADIRTAELAVRSQNGVLLAETINSIRTNLDKYFADDDTAKTIKKTLSNIEQQKLETILPDLSALVKQYEER